MTIRNRNVFKSSAAQKKSKPNKFKKTIQNVSLTKRNKNTKSYFTLKESNKLKEAKKQTPKKQNN